MASNVARLRCIQLISTLRHGTATMAPPGPHRGSASARALHSNPLIYKGILGSLREPLHHCIGTLYTMPLHSVCCI